VGKRGVLPADSRTGWAAVTTVGVVLALMTGFTPRAAVAACSPTPANSGDTVVCSGTDTDGVGSGAENHVSVTVQAGATIAPSAAPFGIDLTYRNSITNNGSVTGSGGGISATNRNTIVNNGTIGDVAASFGISVQDRNTITNNGTIISGGVGIFGGDRNTITNNGVINAAADSSAGIVLNSQGTVTNNGTINGSGIGTAGIVTQDRATITNNGSINLGQHGFGVLIGDGGTAVNNGVISVGDSGVGLTLVTANGGSVINNGTIQAGAQGFSLQLESFGGVTTVTNNGRLDGVIDISGAPADSALINSGTITITNPNTPLGSISSPTYWHFIEGNFTQTASGTLELRVNRDGLSDGLGAADPHLAGTLRAVVLPGLYDAVTTYYSVVYNCGCTGGDLNGTQFDKVIASSPFFTASANYVNNSLLGSGINAVNLVLTRIPFGAVTGETLNQRAVGNALEQGYSTSLTGAPATLYTNLLMANSVAVLDQLSGEGTIATQQTSFLASTLFVQSLMSAASAGPAMPGSSVGPLGYAPQPGQDHPAFRSFAKAPEIDDPARWRFSAGGFGGSLTTKGDGGTGSANQIQSGGAGVASLSYRVDPQLLVGAAVSGGRFSFTSAPRATSGDIDATQGGLFARRDWNTFRITAAFNAATFDNTTSRLISGVGPTELARASFSSNLVGGRIEIARPYALPGLNVTPFAAIQTATLWQRARTETSVVYGTGAPGVLGLATAPVTVTSLPTFLGVQLDNSFDLGAGRILTPIARVAWVHEFRPDRSQDATFTSIPGPSFTVFGPRTAPDAVQIDAGVQLALNSSTMLQASFSSELSGTSSQYSGSGTVRVAW
jgi:uncharacterized protein with beta-barrel porin domain